MRRTLAALLALFALVATACGGAGTPADRLSAVGKATFSDSFHYEFTVDIDFAALGAEVDDPMFAQVAAGVNSFGLEGDHTTDANSMAVSVFGIDVFALVAIGEDRQFVKFDIGPLLSMGGGMTTEGLLAELEAADDIPPDLKPILMEYATPFLRGEWFEFVGFTQEEVMRLQKEFQALLSDVAPEDLASEFEAEFQRQEELNARIQAIFQDFVDGSAETLEEYAVVTESDVDGARVYDVAIRSDAVRQLIEDYLTAVFETMEDDASVAAEELADMRAELAEAFTKVPAQLPIVRVTARDGVIVRYEVDLGRILENIQDIGDDVPAPGTIVFAVDLSDHRQVDDIEVPTPAVTITPDDARSMMKLFARAMQDELAGYPADTDAY